MTRDYLAIHNHTLKHTASYVRGRQLEPGRQIVSDWFSYPLASAENVDKVTRLTSLWAVADQTR